MSSQNPLEKNKDAGIGSRITYTTGFLVSLALTMMAYMLVKHHTDTHHLKPTDNAVIAGLGVLALTQLFAQLVFFLHLDKESKPRWNFVVLVFAVIVVIIVAAGSIWIMYHLNYNMTPQQMNNYLLKQDGGI